MARHPFLKRGLGLVAILSLIVLYQNCSGGFIALPSSLTETVPVSESESSTTPPQLEEATPVPGGELGPTPVPTPSASPMPGTNYNFPVAPTGTSSAAIGTVPTFNNLSLYFKPAEGSSSREALVRYRLQGTTNWTQAQSLWFDSRSGSAIGDRTDRSMEYRGSIVGLRSGSTYEIEVLISGVHLVARTTATTMSENFPIASTVVVGSSSSTLNITQGGTASGYVLYVASPGAVIDVANASLYNVNIQASYVIVRGFTLKGAQKHGIRVKPGLTDVVIEDNDISGWGRIATDGWGINGDAGIGSDYIRPLNIKRLTIQRNKIHHPRSNSNSWAQPRPYYGGNAHPAGPQSVYMNNLDGQFVFRNNEVYSDSTHYFNDCLGGESNFDWNYGFPGNDADIHDNKFNRCWDDGIESEGTNQNVRIYNNFIDQSYVAHGASTTSIGPLYVFRNITNRLQRNADTDPNSSGNWYKHQGKNPYGGRSYVYHNTMLLPQPEGGISDVGASLQGLVSRNNILRSPRNAVIDRTSAPDASCNYDLIDGQINTTNTNHERNAIWTVPQFDTSMSLQSRGLLLGSPGQDQGAIRLPNFNDDFKGAAPDMGAVERSVEP